MVLRSVLQASYPTASPTVLVVRETQPTGPRPPRLLDRVRNALRARSSDPNAGGPTGCVRAAAVFDNTLHRTSESEYADRARCVTATTKFRRLRVGRTRCPLNPDLERLLDNYGTAAAAHTGRSLRDHLIGTLDLLQAWGDDQDICLAGLFHSIYGTQVYARASADLGERNTIRRTIGTRAEELAYLFCACDRRHMLSNVERAGAFVLHDRFTSRDVSLDRGTLAALVEIAFANELEQVPAEADLGSPRYREWRGRWTQCIPFLTIPARDALQARLGAPTPRATS
jgi:hypothetical protein